MDPPPRLAVFSTTTNRLRAWCASAGLPIAAATCAAVKRPRSPATSRTLQPLLAMVPPPSYRYTCAPSSQITSSPGRVCTLIAIWLVMVPLGQNTAASCSNRRATRSSSMRTVGSSPNTSSPSSAWAMASRMAAVGRVTVSLRRSIMLRAS